MIRKKLYFNNIKNIKKVNFNQLIDFQSEYFMNRIIKNKKIENESQYNKHLNSKINRLN